MLAVFGICLTVFNLLGCLDANLINKNILFMRTRMLVVKRVINLFKNYKLICIDFSGFYCRWLSGTVSSQRSQFNFNKTEYLFFPVR